MNGKYAGYHTFESGGSFEIFWDDNDQWRNFDREGNPVAPGWYWWACGPGGLPDGEPNGPFKSSAEAYDDAVGG
jgi:hypothetical protein